MNIRIIHGHSGFARYVRPQLALGKHIWQISYAHVITITSSKPVSIIETTVVNLYEV